MTTTTKQMCDIFFSGSHAFRQNTEAITEIAFLVENGYLLWDKVHIASKAEYLTLISDNNVHHTMDEAAGGSRAHVVLKLLAAKYLKQTYGKAAQYEQQFCGYYPDVLSKDKSIAVECGHTQNPDKILTYFRQEHVKVCIQIPYPEETDTEICGYRFIPGSDLSEFMDAVEAERRVELKSFLRTRSPRR